MTATSQSLTPKQERVRELLAKGQEVSQIAKTMKVTSGAVYGHIRRLRMLGLLPESNGGAPSEPQSGNGDSPTFDGESGTGVDVPTVIRSQIERAKSSLIAIEEEAVLMADRAKALQAQKEQLHAVIERHEQALSAYAVSKN